MAMLCKIEIPLTQVSVAIYLPYPYCNHIGKLVFAIVESHLPYLSSLDKSMPDTNGIPEQTLSHGLCF